MLEDLKTMLQQDPDAQVVANCMSVLLAVSKLVGGCCSCLQHLVHLVCCQLAATHHWLQHLELYLEFEKCAELAYRRLVASALALCCAGLL